MASSPIRPDVEVDALQSEGKVEILSDDTTHSHEPLLGSNSTTEEYSVAYVVLPFFFPALGGLLYGYDIGATSCATISLESPALSGISWYDLSSIEIGLVTSGSLYGALIGSMLAFTVADRLGIYSYLLDPIFFIFYSPGRRKELVLSSLLYGAGALVTSSAPLFAVLIIGRLLFGTGIGLAMHAAPIYIAETSPAQIRGQLISLKEFFIVLGMVMGYAVGSLFVDATSGWRYMYAAGLFFSVGMAVGTWWLPESPRWLLSSANASGNPQRLRETAISCLCRLRGPSAGHSAPSSIDAILSDHAAEKDHPADLTEIFHDKCLRALIIGTGLVFFQQVTGQPSVLYYAASILQSAGFSAAADATRVSILLGILKLVMTGVAVFAVDRVGRRPLLFGGVSGMAVALFLIGSYYRFTGSPDYVAVAALLMFVGCYQLSFGPIGWLMISEIFPLRVRGRGLSIAVLVNFGSNALVTLAFSPLKASLGPALLFYSFGIVTLCSLVFIFFVVPETRGLSLEEIEAKLI